jgi:hypothetical protein
MNLVKLIIGIVLTFISSNIFAQTSEWTTEKTEDGEITVTSKISKRIDDIDGEVQLIEYVATTIANVSLQSCISIMKDISKHKEILNEEVSEMIQTISDNEWLVYYYFDAPWPIPNSDCVTKMSFSEDLINKIATFTIIAEPSSYGLTNVKRLTYYNIFYTFKDLENGSVEITSTAKLTPVFQAPEWIVKNFFPDGPARYIQRLLVLAKSA